MDFPELNDAISAPILIITFFQSMMPKKNNTAQYF